MAGVAGGRQLETVVADVRDYAGLRRQLQTLMSYSIWPLRWLTASVLDHRHDFEVNALGTLNLLEAARESRHLPIVVFSSSNKVYGKLSG